MIETLRWLAILILAALREPVDLALENLAVRQQLAVLRRKKEAPRLRRKDRVFWVALSRIWPQWRKALQLVQADTVIGWQRKGFQIYGARISRRRSAGRPEVSEEVRALIKQMAAANPYWRAPRIYGELLKLGIKTEYSSYFSGPYYSVFRLKWRNGESNPSTLGRVAEERSVIH